MPRNPPLSFSHRNRAPQGPILTDAEHAFLIDTVVPFHPSHIGELLHRAVSVPGGRCVAGTDDDLIDLMETVGVEANGFIKVEEENSGKPLRRPKRGGTADRLLTIYQKLDDYLS